MLEHKKEFEIVFDVNGFMTDPEIPDTQLIDFSVSKNASSAESVGVLRFG